MMNNIMFLVKCWKKNKLNDLNLSHNTKSDNSSLASTNCMINHSNYDKLNWNSLGFEFEKNENENSTNNSAQYIN